jgi:hypothetical protein
MRDISDRESGGIVWHGKAYPGKCREPVEEFFRPFFQDSIHLFWLLFWSGLSFDAVLVLRVQKLGFSQKQATRYLVAAFELYRKRRVRS